MQLAGSGLRTGLLDLDVRAPNITYLLDMPDSCAVLETGAPVPPVFTGGSPPVSVPVFSPAMLFRRGGSILMEGGALRSLARDMLTTVAWPELDWLVVDMDPAPGDTLKSIRETAKHVLGLVVTTADLTSREDAERMLDAFRGLSVITVGVVANMAGMVCPYCGGEMMADDQESGMAEIIRLAERHGTRLLASLPWDRELRRHPAGAAGRFQQALGAIAGAAISAGG